jgi:hypothetical protein
MDGLKYGYRFSFYISSELEEKINKRREELLNREDIDGIKDNYISR